MSIPLPRPSMSSARPLSFTVPVAESEGFKRVSYVLDAKLLYLAGIGTQGGISSRAMKLGTCEMLG